MFGGKAGYGFVLGSRFRLTPQAGIGAVAVKGDGVQTSALFVSGGLRMECVAVNHLGVSLTPEYRFAISRNALFDEISSFSSKVKGWGTGFNVNLGLYFYF